MTTTTGKQTLHASHGRNRVRRQPKDVAFDVVLYLICAVLLILILYPLWFIVIASFSDPSAVAGGHVWFVPVGFTLDGYEELLNQPNVWVGYRNTILYTVVGTLVGLAVNIPAAYALSRRDLWGRKALMGLFVFTMFFSGGLIPIFLTVQELGLYNSFWVMVVPFAVSAYNVIVARTFFETSLPPDLWDAAQIDGCGNLRFFFTIALPLSKAVISVIALWTAVELLLQCSYLHPGREPVSAGAHHAQHSGHPADSVGAGHRRGRADRPAQGKPDALCHDYRRHRAHHVRLSLRAEVFRSGCDDRRGQGMTIRIPTMENQTAHAV